MCQCRAIMLVSDIDTCWTPDTRLNTEASMPHKMYMQYPNFFLDMVRAYVLSHMMCLTH
jgi:hypothetical protein